MVTVDQEARVLYKDALDAPNLQCMYLDRSLRDHTLLQAICRTNRPAPGKSHCLIVDYLGIFDDVAQALASRPPENERADPCTTGVNRGSSSHR